MNQFVASFGVLFKLFFCQTGIKGAAVTSGRNFRAALVMLGCFLAAPHLVAQTVASVAAGNARTFYIKKMERFGGWVKILWGN